MRLAPWFSSVIVGFASLAIAALAGCASGPTIDSSGAYAGPDVRIERGSETYISMFTAPTGGWSVRLDHVRRRFELQQAFITLTRPPRDAPVTQALIEHHVESTVRLDETIHVYVRVINFGATDSGRAYRLGAEASPTGSP